MWHVLAIFFLFQHNSGTAVLTWQGTAAEALRWFAWEDNDTLGEMSRGASRITTRIQCCFLSLVNITWRLNAHVFAGWKDITWTCKMCKSVLRDFQRVDFMTCRRSWSPKWRWCPCRCVTPGATWHVAWHAVMPSQVELSGVKAQQKQLKDQMGPLYRFTRRRATLME